MFPTDTVYGLGVAVEAARSPQALFDIKRRDRGKPVAWLVGDASDLERYGREVPDAACALARAHWPGPLTLVVKASQAVPPAFRSAEGTIGLRMPDSETALALVRAAGGPVATTSANLSGGPAPRTFEGCSTPRSSRLRPRPCATTPGRAAWPPPSWTAREKAPSCCAKGRSPRPTSGPCPERVSRTAASCGFGYNGAGAIGRGGSAHGSASHAHVGRFQVA